MKNIILFAALSISILAACNKVPSGYSQVAPWSGVKPASAVVNGKNYFAKTGVYALNGAAPAPSTIVTTGADTLYSDSLYYVKSLSFVLPNGGGAVNTNILCDTARKDYIINYAVSTRSLRSFNKNQELSNRAYSSLYSNEGVRLKIYVNSATEITATFYGHLGRADKVEGIYLDNGYVSLLK
jgi:hypothetical protein